MRRQLGAFFCMTALLAADHVGAKETGTASATAGRVPARATMTEPEPRASPPRSVPAARASEPSSTQLTERARQLFLLGAEAFAGHRNADAIRYFRRAATLVPSSKLTYNIALAYDEMGDTGRALYEYRAFLAREPESPQEQEVRRRVAELERGLEAAGVQQLSITSEPPGAVLRVGEQIVGVTPWTGELAPGLHRIRLEMSGYQLHEAEIALAAQHASDLNVALTPEARTAASERSALARIEPLTWSFLGVGVGALAAGLAFELSRQSSSEEASTSSSIEAAAEARGAARAKQMASVLSLGVGGAFVVGGSVLLVLDLTHESRAASVRGGTNGGAGYAAIDVPCTPAFCGVLAQGQF